MRRILLVIAALLAPISAASATTVALAGPAYGATEKSIVCKTLTGNEASTLVLGRCSGNTGGGSQPFNAASFASGGTIIWTSGVTTTVGASTLTQWPKPKMCPVSGSAAWKVKAPVTADTSGLPKLGVATAVVCIAPSGAVSALKQVKIT